MAVLLQPFRTSAIYAAAANYANTMHIVLQSDSLLGGKPELRHTYTHTQAKIATWPGSIFSLFSLFILFNLFSLFSLFSLLSLFSQSSMEA